MEKTWGRRTKCPILLEKKKEKKETYGKRSGMDRLQSQVETAQVRDRGDRGEKDGGTVKSTNGRELMEEVY